MSDKRIIFSPERNQWTLTDGRHHMEVPEWAREIMRDEFEHETRTLRDNLDLALDSKRIAERRVTELLAENAKLREELEAVGIAAYSYGRGDLKTENAKLRELVRDLYLCSDETCTDCEHHDYSGEGFWCKRGVGWKKARMRELGIEVDG